MPALVYCISRIIETFKIVISINYKIKIIMYKPFINIIINTDELHIKLNILPLKYRNYRFSQTKKKFI